MNGSRKQIKGSGVKVPSNQWHDIRVEITADRITCYFNGIKQIETTDTTLTSPGKIGLWTKADSVTYFDDLRAVAKCI